MPKAASTVADNVDNLYDFIFWLSLFFFILIVKYVMIVILFEVIFAYYLFHLKNFL